MRFKKILIFIVIYFLVTPAPSYALFEKKDYKKKFLESAIEAEKRHNDKSAFYIYERSLFYYKDDKVVLEAYAKFCERRKYYDKAIDLNKKIYSITKDEYYLFKSYTLELINGNVPTKRLQEIISDKRLADSHRKVLNNQLIKQFFNRQDWQNAKIFCDKITRSDLDKASARACAIASEKLSQGKASYNYYSRYYELNPTDVDAVKKLLAQAEKNNDYATQEKFLKRLTELNPKDNGIKYRLAGFYEKHKKYDKAVKIYEDLMASGDKSSHVTKSYSFALKKSKGEPEIAYGKSTYEPKPLTPYQKKEMQLYQALDAKEFKKAENYINSLLKENPKDSKLLKLQLDITMALNDFKKALSYFEGLYGNSNLTVENQKLLAFLYSKNDNLQKSLEIIENLLQKEPGENKELLNLALDYSMAQKNWDKAVVYNEKLLAMSPSDEKLLKNQGNLYAIKKDYPNAIKSYENLLANFPKNDYKFELAGFYMANKDFKKAEYLFEELYNQNPNNSEILEAYLDSLTAQNKLCQALCIVKYNHLEFTKKGATVMGDAAMQNKDYYAARRHYARASHADKKDSMVKNKLAGSYRLLKERENAARIYHNVLCNEPSNKDAKLGMGYLDVDRKNYEQARHIFNEILLKDSEYVPAKVGIANSYIANGDNLQALSTLRSIPSNDEIKLMKAKTYYKMGMPSDAKKVLSGVITKDAEDLKYKIRRDEAIAITPNYTYFNQQLAQEFKLDYNKMGINVSQGIQNNLNIFTDYNMYVYSSGELQQFGTKEKLNNTTNEVRLGITGRPEEKNEFRADIGAKIFQFNQGHMLNTDTWVKHYFNDKFNLKLGFWRNNVEQSYLSAVGVFLDNALTGQVADNRSYIEYEYRLPKQFYSFGRCSYGVMKGKNLPSNPYMEGMAGIGRLLYNNPDVDGINTVNLDFVSYNSGYRYNLLNIYDNAGILYGGYFSPSYFSADTLNIKIEGKKKKLKYGLKSFGGAQFAINPNKRTSTWGISPYISYDFNDNVTANIFYNYFNYADMQRNVFMFNIVIRGFRKRDKS